MTGAASARSRQRTRLLSRGLISAALLGLAAVPLALNTYVVSLIGLTIMWVAFAASWNLISGYTGYVSFGHSAFFGLGAYVGTLAVTELGIPWPVAGLVAGMVTMIFAIPLGGSMLRLRGPFFAIGMLAVSESLRIVASRVPALTGGGYGLYMTTSADPIAVFYGFLAVLIMVVGTTAIIDKRAFGLQLRSIRDDEDIAAVLGVGTTKAKLVAFSLSAFFPGVLGLIYAQYVSYIDPNSAFAIDQNLTILLIAVMGGVGTVFGPLLGGTVIGGLREWAWINLPRYHLLGFGILVIIVTMLWPDGLVPRLARALQRRTRHPDRETGSLPEADRVPRFQSDVAKNTPSTEKVLLTAESVRKSFGGMEVLRCSLQVQAGSITALIGPNGSGKSTLFNCISGVVTPDAGSIILDGTDLRGMRPHEIAHLGLGRTFQLSRVFGRMTVLENMLVPSTTKAFSLASPQDLALEYLDMVGLEFLKHEPAAELSYGQRKLLEVARALMLQPKLILMDEPFAGVNPLLRERISDLIRYQQATKGITFFIIGHEMAEIMALAMHVMVMDQGAVIAAGTPREVRGNERVLEAYFGRAREKARGGSQQDD